MSENQLFTELIRYYQQLDALIISKDWESDTKANTKTFYLEKIDELRIRCHEANPKRLAELVTRRANDCPINEAEQIS